jgi:(2Fe-2S) ferredoxin
LLEAVRAELLLRGATAGAIDVRPVGCMDQCEHGPAMVAYSGAAAEENEPPEGVRRIFVWAAKRYKGVKSGDVVGICDGLVRIARG